MMEKMRLAAITLAISALTSAVAYAQADFASRYGPKVGAPAPAFRAPDQSGVQRDFASLRGPKGLFLLFVRSADW